MDQPIIEKSIHELLKDIRRGYISDALNLAIYNIGIYISLYVLITFVMEAGSFLVVLIMTGLFVVSVSNAARYAGRMFEKAFAYGFLKNEVSLGYWRELGAWLEGRQPYYRVGNRILVRRK